MIRTRFAPSPTGYIHVGNVRSAFFAWLLARSQNGKFILRIEDTDTERSNVDYTEQLLNDLEWLGLTWDEGPRIGGEYGPYFQSERLPIYQQYTQQLLDSGYAYKCYCTEQELLADKEQAEKESHPPHYQGRCRNLTEQQQRKFEDQGLPFTVRFKVFHEDFTFNDMVKGEVIFPSSMVGDFVIVRANNIPVYNYAVVIDDITMKITHVLRGDEHLSNTVRQLMIYKALNYIPPQFGHMALVLGEDRKKLSKRHGATSIREFKNLGYLPESLCNALALLGWSSPTGEEILSIEQMIELFNVNRISPSPSIFDFKRLDWISKHNILSADLDRIVDLSLPYLQKRFNNLYDRSYIESVINIVRGSCTHLSQIPNYTDYFFSDDYLIENEAESILSSPKSGLVLKVFIQFLEMESRAIDQHVYTELIDQVKKITSINGKNLFLPIRAALTGKVHGPEIFLIIPILGKKKTLIRLKKCVEESL